MVRYLPYLLLAMVFNQPAAAASFNYAFSPHQGATDLVVQAIDSAQTSLDLAAYQFTSKAIGNALIEADHRGVKVRLVLDKSSRNSPEVQELENYGVPLRINSRYKIMHDKFIIIDGKSLETGSFNYTESAERNNAENVLVIHEQSDLAQAYETQFEKLWHESKDIISYAP